MATGLIIFEGIVNVNNGFTNDKNGYDFDFTPTESANRNGTANVIHGITFEQVIKYDGIIRPNKTYVPSGEYTKRMFANDEKNSYVHVVDN